MDGTLFDVPYDWQRIRNELETRGKPILAHLQSLEEPERTAKWKKLEKLEHEATLKARLKKGIPELLDYLTRIGVKQALVTNNTKKNVIFLLKKFRLDFDYILTRESGLWKPSGRPFVTVLEWFDLRKDECCVIGDSHFDVQAAAEAGIAHVFILSPHREQFSSTHAHICESIYDVQIEIENLFHDPEKAKTRS
jgi:HAD superfamily hydrolase (TIGR01549 family)